MSVRLSRFVGELCGMLCSVLSRVELPSIEVDSLIFTSSNFSSKQGNASFKLQWFYASPKPLLSGYHQIITKFKQLYVISLIVFEAASTIVPCTRWAKVTVPSSLLSRLLPGPVTTVFERGGDLNPALNPGLPLVGLRIPDSSFVRCLVEQCGCPLALTSANLSHSSSTLCTGQH